jgi:glycosyltransferase involved in cell wall biosynthesis
MARITILWQYLTGYAASGFHALVEQGHDVRLIHQEAIPEPPYCAPFDDAELTKGIESISWKGQPDQALVLRELEAFQPEVILINSWHIPAYMKAGRRWKGRALRVVVMDHQWHGTPRQWFGRMISRFYLQPALDAALLPGDEQAVFARHLGFEQREIIVGMNTCDSTFFTGPQDPPRDAFLFAGRLVDTKGIDVLAAAYRAYRDQVPDPWPLKVVGIGPMDAELEAIEGVELLGFVRPEDLPPVMAETGCLLLPSRFEPWGVVIQEAAASGQPVICTHTCGAASRLVLDGYNGRVIAPDRPDELVQAMRWVHDLSPERRREMSGRSVELAKQYTPQRWAEHLVERSLELLPHYVDR